MTRRLILTTLCLTLAACNGVNQGGLINTTQKPNGVFTATLKGPGTVMSTTQSAPTPVSGGFSINIGEGHYFNYFTATISSFTAAAEAPCLLASGPSSTLLSFTQQESPALNGNPTSPCQTGSDVESILIRDSAVPTHSITVWVLRSP